MSLVKRKRTSMTKEKVKKRKERVKKGKARKMKRTRKTPKLENKHERPFRSGSYLWPQAVRVGRGLCLTGGRSVFIIVLYFKYLYSCVNECVRDPSLPLALPPAPKFWVLRRISSHPPFPSPQKL